MAFEELKQRQAAMWGAGPFEKIAVTLEDMHELIVDSVDAGPGDRWLDVGCGTGELALRATRTGAQVQGADLAPALVETARRQAAEQGHDLTFEVADCEELPFEDASFDVVTSSVGAIFAPDHPRVASELTRVLRPGGRLALTAWTAEGQVGEFFQLIGRYAPPPPEGSGSSLAWGDQIYSTRLLGDELDLEFSHHNVPWRGESGEEMWDEMAEAFGPIVVLLRSLDDETATRFRTEMIELFGRLESADGVVLPRPFLLTRGTKR